MSVLKETLDKMDTKSIATIKDVCARHPDLNVIPCEDITKILTSPNAETPKQLNR